MSDWWRSAVLYEIYVRSFQDADGDGLGDLPGIRSRLPYLRDLGVDGIWLTPFYPSPGADHGYDVSDYEDVDPLFGSLEDFDALVADAHKLGLRVVVDIVPNHTSDQHEWFQGAISGPAHSDRDRFMFRQGRDGGPPNNWMSAFGGPAWSRDETTGEWYLHFFAPEQPDLDWHNPLVQADFEQILRFWLDRGVDGFRIDVAHALFKDQSLRDVQEPDPRPPFGDWLTQIDQPELHPLYRRWRSIVDEYPDERILVGEIVLENQEKVANYVRPDELHLSFNFKLLYEEWDAAALRATIDMSRSALDAVGATPTWVLENHDVRRLPTRYGGGEEGLRRARAAALMLLALPGTVFLYAGQELGLEEVDIPDELRQDPIFFRSHGERKGRDGCRVPIPWERTDGLGFTTGTPWLPVPAEWASASVTAQEDDPASMLSLYREALALRPRDEPFAWRESPAGTLVFERGDLVCVVNIDGKPLERPEGELLLASEPGIEGKLPRSTAAWIKRGAGT